MTRPVATAGAPVSVASDRQRRWAIALVVCAVAPAPYPGSEVAIALSVALLVTSCLADDPSLRQPVTARLPIAIGLLAVASSSWSAAPLYAVRGGLLLLTLAVASMVVARTVCLRQVLSGMALGLRMLLVASLAAAAVLLSFGLVQDAYETGALQGVFNHRNLLAFVAICALVTFWCTRGQRRRSLVTLDMALAMICLIGSRSSSALVILAAVIVVGALVYFASRARRFSRALLLFVGASGVAGFGVLAAMHLDVLTGMLGRDTTFTGRTVIWETVLEVITGHAILGVGWDAAWHDDLALMR